MPERATSTLNVTVLYSPAQRQMQEWRLHVTGGTTVLEALANSVFAAFPALRTSQPVVGIWGRTTGLSHVLKEGDRLEVYRALQVDPKVARRERFKDQGARTTGLFAKKRAGAKAGY
jgi:uncharacterized protein